MDRLAPELVPPNHGGDRPQRRRRAPGPVRRRRALEVEAVAGVDRALVAVRKAAGRAQAPRCGPGARAPAGHARWAVRVAAPARGAQLVPSGAGRPGDAGRVEPRPAHARVSRRRPHPSCADGRRKPRAGLLGRRDLGLHVRDVIGDRPLPGRCALSSASVSGGRGRPVMASGVSPDTRPSELAPRTRSGAELPGALARGAVAVRPSPRRGMARRLDRGWPAPRRGPIRRRRRPGPPGVLRAAARPRRARPLRARGGCGWGAPPGRQDGVASPRAAATGGPRRPIPSGGASRRRRRRRRLALGGPGRGGPSRAPWRADTRPGGPPGSPRITSAAGSGSDRPAGRGPRRGARRRGPPPAPSRPARPAGRRRGACRRGPGASHTRGPKGAGITPTARAAAAPASRGRQGPVIRRR